MAQKLDWVIVPDALSITEVLPESSYSYDIYNITDRQALRYGERTWGINLVWTDPSKSDNVRFLRQSESKESIRFEEPVAVNIRGGGWLIYKKRDTGINLGWSDKPHFEWKFMGGKAGDVIKTGTKIGLFSAVEKDYLMYETRDWGINLKWFKDSGKYNTLNEIIDTVTDIKSFAEKVAPIAGYVALI